MDVMADPKAAPVIRDYMKKIMKTFAPEEEQGGTEAAKEAITEEMNMAMMQYMPLRGVFSFSDGVSAEDAEEMLKKLNN